MKPVATFTVSRDDGIYEAWPDLLLTPSGRLICVFWEGTFHTDRRYSRVMLTESDDRGRTWTPKHPLSAPGNGWGAPRLSRLGDGRIVAIANRCERELVDEKLLPVFVWFSADQGATWDGPRALPALGCVPDKLLELPSGRWIVSCQYYNPPVNYWQQRLWYSDDQGRSWHGPVSVAEQRGLHLCEASILRLPDATLVAFLRENSGEGRDCYKAISHDDGEHWEGVYRFPLPGCHRPVAGLLQSGRVLITYRFMQGGKEGFGYWTQNFCAALTDVTSAAATERIRAWTRDHAARLRSQSGIGRRVFGVGAVRRRRDLRRQLPRRRCPQGADQRLQPPRGGFSTVGACRMTAGSERRRMGWAGTGATGDGSGALVMQTRGAPPPSAHS